MHEFTTPASDRMASYEEAITLATAVVCNPSVAPHQFRSTASGPISYRLFNKLHLESLAQIDPSVDRIAVDSAQKYNTKTHAGAFLGEVVACQEIEAARYYIVRTIKETRNPGPPVSDIYYMTQHAAAALCESRLKYRDEYLRSGSLIGRLLREVIDVKSLKSTQAMLRANDACVIDQSQELLARYGQLLGSYAPDQNTANALTFMHSFVKARSA